MKMLLQNHDRALQIDEEKIKVNPEPLENNSADKIEISNNSFKNKINELNK